jgi:hypothetical protein
MTQIQISTTLGQTENYTTNTHNRVNKRNSQNHVIIVKHQYQHIVYTTHIHDQISKQGKNQLHTHNRLTPNKPNQNIAQTQIPFRVEYHSANREDNQNRGSTFSAKPVLPRTTKTKHPFDRDPCSSRNPPRQKSKQPSTQNNTQPTQSA